MLSDGKTEVTLHLPWPPTSNHYWRHQVVKGRARIFLGSKGKAYRQHVALLTRPLGLSGSLSVCITAHPPDNRKRDLDNLQKSLLDSITCAGVWQDDSQIMHLSITMGVKRKDGGVTVRISPGWEPEADII